MAGSYRSPSVDRAFQVVDALCTHRAGRTLTELSRETHVPPSTLLAILGSLKSHRIVRSVGRRYALDVGIFQLGQAYVEGLDLTARFFAVAHELVTEFDETVYLGVLAGSDVVYILCQECSTPIRWVAKAGRRIPAHTSAIGRAILAYLPPTDLERVIQDLLPKGKIPNELRNQLDEVHRTGVSESREDCMHGLHCIATPIFDTSGWVIAGISLSVPIFRLNPSRRRKIIAALKGATERLATEEVAGRLSAAG